MNIPEDAILKISPKKEIEQTAQLEAMMSFKKAETNHSGTESVYLYPEYVKNKSDLFYFAMIYGKTLGELQHGLRKVPKQVEQMFASENN